MYGPCWIALFSDFRKDFYCRLTLHIHSAKNEGTSLRAGNRSKVEIFEEWKMAENVIIKRFVGLKSRRFGNAALISSLFHNSERCTGHLINYLIYRNL